MDDKTFKKLCEGLKIDLSNSENPVALHFRDYSDLMDFFNKIEEELTKLTVLPSKENKE